MSVIETISAAKCKDCKFAEKYRPIKKDGTSSWKTKTKCTNPESPRSDTDIRQSDLVCDKWKLLYT